MKKQDILTPIGLILVIGTMLYGANGELGFGIFFDIPSIVITIVGSFSAVLITFSMTDMKRMLKIIKMSFSMNSVFKPDLIDQFKELSKKVRKDGFLSIEGEISEIEDDYLRKGLELVIDGIEQEKIKEILELEMMETENSYNQGSQIFKIWGSYAPAFGMLGTLIGLIQMLAGGLGDQDQIATGMGKALITTLYGAFAASAILNPLGFNVQNKGQKEVATRDMMLAGIMSMQDGDNARIIEEKLLAFLSEEEKKVYLNRSDSSSKGVGEDVA